jgi:hypothetical protein
VEGLTNNLAQQLDINSNLTSIATWHLSPVAHPRCILSIIEEVEEHKNNFVLDASFQEVE